MPVCANGRCLCVCWSTVRSGCYVCSCRCEVSCTHLPTTSSTLHYYYSPITPRHLKPPATTCDHPALPSTTLLYPRPPCFTLNHLALPPTIMLYSQPSRSTFNYLALLSFLLTFISCDNCSFFSSSHACMYCCIASVCHYVFFFRSLTWGGALSCDNHLPN